MANKRYQIWDKTSIVITPSGEVFTPEQWMDRYPIARIDGIKVVISGGIINGAFFGELTSMMDMYEKDVDFSNCVSDQEILDAIEEFETRVDTNQDSIITPEERIAAALEAQVMLAMPDEEEV